MTEAAKLYHELELQVQAQLKGEVTLEIEECGSLLYRMADLWDDMTEKERNKADKRAREFNAKWRSTMLK